MPAYTGTMYCQHRHRKQEAHTGSIWTRYTLRGSHNINDMCPWLIRRGHRHPTVPTCAVAPAMWHCHLAHGRWRVLLGQSCRWHCCAPCSGPSGAHGHQHDQTRCDSAYRTQTQWGQMKAFGSLNSEKLTRHARCTGGQVSKH